MERHAYRELVDWKVSSDRKPLILRGARHCGKTYLLKQFGSREFDNVVYCDFESISGLRGIFKGYFHPKLILSDLGIISDTRIVPGKTLLILDEIQGCDDAILSLRYFREQFPDLHIVCACSYLHSPGVIDDVSEDVSILNLYPMNFREFLEAEGESLSITDASSDPCESLSSEQSHDHALRLLRDYCVVGGMPEVVESWVTEHDVRKVDELQRRILDDYSETIERCGGKLSKRILSVWSSIPMFLSRSNHKFIFRDLKKDGRASDFESSVQWLSDAHLIHRVNQLDRHVFPSAIVDDPGLYKLYLCDIGLLRVMSGQPVDVMLSDSGGNMSYKDGMYENLVVCELDSSDIDGLYYWRDRRYEADLVVRVGDSSIPIDVCFGNACDNESLNAYAKVSGESRSVVMSDRPFTDGDRKIIPFYDVSEVDYRSMIDGDGSSFIMDISEDMWVRDRNSFLLRIPLDKHRMGRSPRCTVVDDNADHMPIAIGVLYNGDVVLKSNTISRGRVIIEESESEMVL